MWLIETSIKLKVFKTVKEISGNDVFTELILSQLLPRTPLIQWKHFNYYFMHIATIWWSFSIYAKSVKYLKGHQNKNGWKTIEFLLKVFTEFSDKNICHYSKRSRSCHLLCKRPGCYNSTSKTHVRDMIFKFSPIHASVIYQITWIQGICWIRWKSCAIKEKLQYAQLTKCQILAPKIFPHLKQINTQKVWSIAFDHVV